MTGYSISTADVTAAHGNDNPTLAFNLTGITDYDQGHQFLDITQSMRSFIGHEPGKWGGMSGSELRSKAAFDQNNWPTVIPEELEKIGTIWQWKSGPDRSEAVSGRYIVDYDGEGDLRFDGDARIISSEPGRIVFDNLNGHNLYMNIYETDPNGTGNYIRNVSVVREDDYDLYEAGAVFNPEWTALIEDSRQLRFMDWNGTNNSRASSWEGRVTPEKAGTKAVSVEYQVQLANEVGADPWFNIPHLASDEYIRNFAIYVRDNLDPELVARVEYSNETWNWAFQQSQWLLKSAQEEWGNDAFVDYHAKKATETALIWEDVFKDEPDGRLVNVIGTQTNEAMGWMAERLMNPYVWRNKEPDTFVEPSTVFEELAVTTYFGGMEVVRAANRNALLEKIADPNVDAVAYLAEKIRVEHFEGDNTELDRKWSVNKEVADRYGLDLVAYEGGQHIHHSFNVRAMKGEVADILTGFLTEFVRTDEVAEMHRMLWDAWAEYGDGPFMQFGDVKTPARSGSFGLYETTNEETARAAVLNDLNDVSTPWWDGATGGDHYRQGVIERGTANDDILIGTTQEDYLLGGAGNDLLVGGAGNDGFNGGDGIDRVLLSGSRSDYTVVTEGKGYRITGLDGSDFAIHVEELAFDDGTVMAIDAEPASVVVEPEPPLELGGGPRVHAGRQRPGDRLYRRPADRWPGRRGAGALPLHGPGTRAGGRPQS